MSRFINVHTVSIVGTTLLILGLFAYAPDAHAVEPGTGTFYQWVDNDGVTSVTDDVKHIPAMYRDRAVARNIAEVGEDAKVTEMVIPGADYAAALEASLERSRKIAARIQTSPRVEGCNGPITVSQERRNYEERGNSYNSMFYVVKDACGNVTSVTRENPIPLIRVE